MSSAIRGRGAHTLKGDVAAQPLGGDHTLKRIEAHGAPILATSEQQTRLFLREIRRRLAGERPELT